MRHELAGCGLLSGVNLQVKSKSGRSVAKVKFSLLQYIGLFLQERGVIIRFLLSSVPKTTTCCRSSADQLLSTRSACFAKSRLSHGLVQCHGAGH